MQRVLSIIFYPLIAVVAVLLKILPKRPYHYYPILDKLFVRVGVYPILNHFYTPFVIPGKDFNEEKYRQPRHLPAVDLNGKEQLILLNSFSFKKDLLALDAATTADITSYSFTNDTFAGGDGEMYYNMICHFKPKRIIEIGSGHSTKLAWATIKNIQKKDTAYQCALTSIEPFSNPWLEQIGAEIIRRKVEDIDVTYFESLVENDILFIDSSHVIRPEGDVLFEYLNLLPALKKGVVIHIHDIFTPFHYPLEWIKERRLWHEQYLLEGFLSYNEHFKIVLSNPYLGNFHTEAFMQACPILTKNKSDNYGSSIWLQKVR
ncbi:MAG TPA: class I SAM-dependent methyltransferase [Flavisolibacter sp.]|jgi:hypothetical protein